MLETDRFEETLAFWTEKLGFTGVASLENDWAKLRRDRAELMFSAPNAHRNFEKPLLTGSIYFRTDRVDEIWKEFKDKVEVSYGIENFDYGMREFGIYDNNGYLIQFGQEW